MYISSWEIQELNQLWHKYLDDIKIEIDIPLTSQEKLEEDSPKSLKNKLNEKLTETISSYRNFFVDYIKNKVYYEMEKYIIEIPIKEKICNFDDCFFYIFKRKLRELFQFQDPEITIREHEKYEDLVNILKEYYDDLNKILELEIDSVLKFIRMYTELFKEVEEEKDYIYESSKYFIISSEKVGGIFKKYNFNMSNIALFNKIAREFHLRILIFKDKIYVNEKKEKVYDNPEGKKIENVYLFQKGYINDIGKLFEATSYLYVRKILKQIEIPFLSTHNLQLGLKRTEEEKDKDMNDTLEKEIDIPIILFYEGKYLFIPIECKFTGPDKNDLYELIQLKRKLNDIPVSNKICILTADSSITQNEEDIDIVPISKFREWIKELLIKKF